MRRSAYPKNRDDKELCRLRSNIAVCLCRLKEARQFHTENAWRDDHIAKAQQGLMSHRSVLYMYCLDDPRYRDEFKWLASHA